MNNTKSIELEILNSKILLVDDEPGNVKVIKKLLNVSGFPNVMGLTESKHVLKAFSEFNPDLVILDLKMPQFDGYQIMNLLKEFSDGDYLPILILTAQRDQETRLKALNSGAKDFLNKPFDVAEGVTRIKNMLEVRILHKQIRRQNQNLGIQVKQRTMDLEVTRLDVILRLGRASEYRDNETGMHVIRMGHLSGHLARRIHLKEKECQTIQDAAPMHDVGKIGIPDRILLKPGKLNGEEWEIMKSHTTIGEKILAGGNSDLMKLAETIAVSHHERWDGSGYPNGQKGEEIPLVGRIVAVCDVFDALTSERPYKKAWTVADAMEEIENNSGIHFDPELVRAFKNHLPEMLEILKQFPDSKEDAVHLYALNAGHIE